MNGPGDAATIANLNRTELNLLAVAGVLILLVAASFIPKPRPGPARAVQRNDFPCIESQAFLVDAHALISAKVRGDVERARALRASLDVRAHRMDPACRDLLAGSVPMRKLATKMNLNSK